jgi:hypothetical protein
VPQVVEREVRFAFTASHARVHVRCFSPRVAGTRLPFGDIGPALVANGEFQFASKCNAVTGTQSLHETAAKRVAA